MANHYFDTIINLQGDAVEGAVIYATLNTDDGSVGQLATIYSDDGVSIINQDFSPVKTDANGFYQFWTDETSLTLSIVYRGVSQRVIVEVATLGEGFVGDVKEITTEKPPVYVSDTEPETVLSALWFKTIPGSDVATLWVKEAD